MDFFNTKKAKLVLENGMVFEGKSFGKEGTVVGEIIFTTSMTGYQETLTDPSYCGQIVTQTFPLIGNYGVNSVDFESHGSVVSGYVVREHCIEPSNFRSEGTIDSFLKKYGIVGIYDIDTRSLTRIIRDRGVMNAKITTDDLDLEATLKELSEYSPGRNVPKMSVKEKEIHAVEGAKYNVALIDYGYKFNIRRELQKIHCNVTIYPWNTKAEDIIKDNPDGIMLSNGPGDPSENVETIEELRKLFVSNIPIFGICLGHQLMAIANGGKTKKLKYGHRGCNQPVTDLKLKQTFITSQNHGYTVLSESIAEEIGEISHINANDNTCEGIYYKNAPVLTVQFHPEAHGGPNDTSYLFNDFVKLMEENKKCR